MVKVNESAPLYHKLSEEINQKIDDGIWEVGSKIPSERELVEKYGLSRITVRNAIAECVNQGRLEKIQGKGTFVVDRKIVQRLANVYSFSDEMKKQGKVSSTEVICCVVVDATEFVAKKLGLGADASVIFLERLRFADKGKPVIIEKTYFPYEEYEFLLNIDLGKVSLYKTLEEKHGIKIDRAVETFKACELRPAECRLLECGKNHYGLKIKRMSYMDEKPVCYSTIVSKNDVFEFTIELKS